MGYANLLKTLFQGVTLKVEDLFFLESFQIKYLPDRVPKQEFAVLLDSNPIIHRYLVAMYPPISNFIHGILKEKEPVKNNKKVDENIELEMIRNRLTGITVVTLGEVPQY